MSYDFDLITIGGGSAGVRASRVAASLGAKVALVEASRLGGTCVNLGCIPKKMLVYAAELGDELGHAGGFGFELESPVKFSWAALTAQRNKEVERLNGVYRRLLETSGVEIVEGRALITGPNQVDVEGRAISARYILVATGSRPASLDITGSELAIFSDQAFSLQELPERVLVVGAGYIALEFASIFRGLGAQVELVHRGRALLSGFDDDVRSVMAEELRRRGIVLHLGTELSAIRRTGAGLKAELSLGSSVDADQVLIAVGRTPRTEGLGLEAAGVELGQDDEVVVGERYQSSVPSIFAIGDVINRAQLTPVAIQEGVAVAYELFGGDRRARRFSYERVPTAVFALPPLGTVGLTEREAKKRLSGYRVYQTRFKPLRNALTGSEERTFMKLITDAHSGRVVGFHMVGRDAPELAQVVAIAMTAGATKADFDHTMSLHPTAAEELVTLALRP